MSDFPLAENLHCVEVINVDAANSRATQINSYSYVQMVASTAADTSWIQLSVGGPNEAVAQHVRMDIAVGASSSEEIIIEKLSLYTPGSTLDMVSVNLMLPLAIPAGTRISARSYLDGTTTAAKSMLIMHLFAGEPNTQASCSRLAHIGFVTVDPGSSANTKASYAQVSASTPLMRGMLLGMANTSTSNGNENYLLDVAVGASSSEEIILPDFGMGTMLASDTLFPFMSPVFPIQVPAGTRLSARAASRETDATDRVIELDVWGLV